MITGISVGGGIGVIRVAIVEDQKREADTMRRYLLDYAQKSGEQIDIGFFQDALSFISNYSASYHLILMDIQMPNMDGMTAAERIRKVDTDVIIVFVTNMVQYAVRGYKVAALDFILKPISWFEFSNMMDKVFEQIHQKGDHSFIVSINRETRRIPADQVKYIEVQRHKLFYHTQDEVLESWGSLASLEEIMPPKMFAKVNAGTIVNLNYVTAIKDDSVLVAGEVLPLSRRRKKELLAEIAHYFGEERGI